MGQAISWAPRPMTSSSGSSLGSPWVSYAISMPLDGAVPVVTGPSCSALDRPVKNGRAEPGSRFRGHDRPSGCTPACRTRRSPSSATSGPASRTSGSTGSRSGTTSTPPTSTATSATRRSPATPRWPATPPGCGSARSSTAPATGTPPCWPTPSPPSTTSPAAGPTSASAPAGRSTSTAPTASRSRRPASASTCSRSRSRRSAGLLRDEVTDFTGKHFTLTEARCEPKPVQAELPIWVGGSGEKRTLRIAARYADGWNVPFVSPETVAHKRNVLADHCAAVGRDPARDPHGGERRPVPRRRRAAARSSAASPRASAPAC